MCRKALQDNPGDINFVALLGWILAESNQLEEAAVLLQQAVRTTPTRQGQEDLGTVLLNLNRTEEAVAHLERALLPRAALRPNWGVPTKLGRLQEADEALKRAAELSPVQANWRKPPACL